MASVRSPRRSRPRPRVVVTRPPQATRPARAAAVDAARLAERRAHVERRLRFLAREESRLALAGNFEEACEAARERRYWQFVRALLAAPAGARRGELVVH